MRIKGKLIFTWICLLFALAPSSCAAPRPLGLPFSVSQVEKIELYRFVIPAQAKRRLRHFESVKVVYWRTFAHECNHSEGLL